MMPPHLLKAVLSQPDSMDDLTIYELSTDRILLGVMPGSEELLPEVDAPGRLALTFTLGPGQLFTLGNGI